MAVDMFPEVIGARCPEAELTTDRLVELQDETLVGVTGESATELSAHVAQAVAMRTIVGREQEQPSSRRASERGLYRESIGLQSDRRGTDGMPCRRSDFDTRRS